MRRKKDKGKGMEEDLGLCYKMMQLRKVMARG